MGESYEFLRFITKTITMDIDNNMLKNTKDTELYLISHLCKSEFQYKKSISRLQS